ncbi:hypothetical protein [Streptomyces sp. NPDC001744]|uniref:hypothetical protein n=1 Tax=Streptomyces sp. NPDC001744 TaxID=3364606 RepID=UPI003675166F
MRGDESQPALVKGGPRHAAPRKTLLNRIQGPAGKAMALAAMPTAVFVGMSLTPKLALADDEAPFASAPCVSRSDEPTPEATETPKPTKSAQPTATPSASATASATTAPTGAPSAPATPAPTATDATAKAGGTTARRTREEAKTTAPAATPTPTATPSPARTRNPLDPLGVGDALKDLFGGLDPSKPKATPTTAAPTTTAPATRVPAGPATADEKPAASAAPEATTAPKTTADPKPAADPAAERTKAAIREAAEKAGVGVAELPEDVKGLDAKKDEDIPEGAKPRYPCPEHDEKALADADLEPGIPLLPDDPWRLESSLLTLSGLKYHGIVEVRTYGGRTKKVLKFTATKVQIKDLHQLTVHSEGRTGHVRSRKGEESTITDGTVTMYTEELKGKIFGIPFLPITFSPETPPPLDVSYVWFTDVKLKQAGQFGGTLRVPGLRNTIEPN